MQLGLAFSPYCRDPPPGSFAAHALTHSHSHTKAAILRPLVSCGAPDLLNTHTHTSALSSGNKDTETRMIADPSHSRARPSPPRVALRTLTGDEKSHFPRFFSFCPSRIVERQTTYSSSPRQAKGTSSVHLARGLLQPSKWPIGGDGFVACSAATTTTDHSR